MLSKFRFLFCLSLVFVIPTDANPLNGETSVVKGGKGHIESQIEEADNLFKATLFDKAVPIYQNLLSNPLADTEDEACIRLRLAQCYFFTEQYTKVSELFSDLPSSDFGHSSQVKRYYQEGMFLLGISFNKLKRYDKAIATLLRYLSLEEENPPPFREEAQYELGLAYFHQQDFSAAKKQFETFPEKSKKVRLLHLSRIYLARISIAQGKFPEAEAALDVLVKQIDANDVFRYWLSFLHGEILFRQENWVDAASHFEKALPLRNQNKAEWYEDTLYQLGLCYLYLGDDSSRSPINQEQYLSKAEEVLLSLVLHAPSDRAYLALAQCYLSKGNRLKDPIAFQELESLLSEKATFKSRESLHHALLLKAEAAPSYSERKKIFRQLTHESNKDGPYYANAWYLRGLNELDEGQKHVNTLQNNETKKHLDHATSVLGQAFDLLYPTNKKLAALALKYQAQAHYYQNSREEHLKGLAVLSELLNRYRDDLFPLLDKPDEVFFLQGLIASNLLDGEKGETYFTVARNSLNHNMESYPNGEFHEETVKLLGILYYQKGDFEKGLQIFLELANISPPSSLAGEALFWAANCVDSLGTDLSQSKQYRQKVFEQYPDSPFAEEAYFRYYSYHEYLKGSHDAIEHLKSLEGKFPNSPFQINAYYLIGLDYLKDRKSDDGRRTRDKDMNAAIEAFQKAEITFDSLFESEAIPEEKHEYFITLHYRNILESALAFINLAKDSGGAKKRVYLENAEKILHGMYTDFESPKHPLAKVLVAGKSITPLQEQCAYYLAKCYTNAGNEKAAERVLAKMLEKYQSAKITRGYYLSRVWHQQGLIAMKNKENKLALDYFKHAEDAAKGKILHTEELLDLWIQQSFCHSALDQTDEAMLILSKVINYDAISSQRLKAMYLRAKIYEQQERYELARKQLEATAKKGGKWAKKAKENLEENYVYQ
ncbi:MAG: Lipopolysaccharide assembly protein B [Chlamydiae bacterium]|nr:Lipopolysaccharide assembly protein B [Chlamydiota bacterium]